MQGLVTKISGSSYQVLADSGESLECFVKGNFRIKGIRSTNPLAVGDRVVIEQLKDGTNWITDIFDRRNYIIRRSTNLSKRSHILAANIDQALLFVTINHPKTNIIFIDRFLATAEAYRIPACLLFNKTDLLNDDEKEYMQAMQALYQSLGYTTLAISALLLPEDNNMQQQLSHLLRDKTTLLSGNSGVGKSTLLNMLVGEELTRTGNISQAHDKGMHTTTFSAMYRLPEISDDTWLIDTPGIKGFGVLDMQREEVGHYFKEIFQESAHCRFSNCTHTNEPGCAVKQAVDEHRIALSRYESYLSVLDDADEQKYR